MFQLTDWTDPLSVACSLYLMAIRKWCGINHVYLVLEDDHQFQYKLHMTWQGVELSEFTSADKMLVHHYLEVPMEFFSQQWMESAITHAHFFDVRPGIWNHLKFPFVKKKPFICTSFLEHLLLLPIEHRMPCELDTYLSTLYKANV